MRKSLILSTVLLSMMVVLSGCMEQTGDVGNKNIRQSALNKKRFAKDQDNDLNRINGRRQENNNIIGMHGNSRIELSDSISEHLNTIPGVSAAFVMLTEQNAYVAVRQNSKAAKTTENADLTDELKNKIADRVISLSPSTQNVYVSTNPDFLGRMQGYADVVKQGHPIQGLLVEFNAMVERIFPAASGTRNR